MSRANTPNGTRNGKRRSVYLDDATVEAARVLGDGNIGEGIRRAVALQAICLCGHPLSKHAEVQGFTSLGACGLFSGSRRV